MRIAKKKRPSKLSSLELAFLTLWENQYGIGERPVMQHRFHAVRQWRFDFAWPPKRLAIEIDGGIFIGGGHSRGMQYTADCEKANAAVMLGWKLLRYTTKDLEKRPVQVVEEVHAFLLTLPGAAPAGLFDGK